MKNFIDGLKAKHSTRELVMLLILVIFIVYYLCVQLPVTKIGGRIDEEQAKVDNKIAAAEEKLTMMPAMLAQINQYKTSSDEYITPKTDNTKGVIRGYHDIIGDVDNYSISFNGETTEGKVTRKNMTLSFSTDSYNDALNKIEDLENNRNGFLINQCNLTGGATGANYATQVWNVSVSITEFEYDVNA